MTKPHQDDEPFFITEEIAAEMIAGGYEFDWWCTDEPDAFVGTEPVYVAARDDLVELTSPEVYDLLVDALDRRRAAGIPDPVHPGIADPGGQRLHE